MKMKFRKDNKIPYRQDFRGHISLPSGIDFSVITESGAFANTDCIMLIADGYGNLLGGNYGNGAIYVPKASLSRKQLKRFEANILPRHSS